MACDDRALHFNFDPGVSDLQRVLNKMDAPLYDVFLGGSCGETTWRRDVVIPRLQQMQCSYFDPQGAEWNETMRKDEALAKKSCRILLWVVHPAYSSIVTLIEIAHFVASKAPLVVVFLSCDQDISKISDCGISEREIMKCRDIIKGILEENSVPTFKSIEQGMDDVKRRLLLAKPYLIRSKNIKVRNSYLSELRRKEWEDNQKYYQAKMSGVLNVVSHALAKRSSVSYVVLLCVALLLSPPFVFLLLVLLLIVFHVGFVVRSKSNFVSVSRPPHYDIYVGGSGEERSHFHWVDSLAVPKLSRRGYSYMHGGYMVDSGWTNRCSVLSQCRLIFYRLQPSPCIFSAMVELAYLAGVHKSKLVVCVPSSHQYLCDVNDNHHKWVKTWSRAEGYLNEILEENRVVHTNDVNTAIDALMKMGDRRIANKTTRRSGI